MKRKTIAIALFCSATLFTGFTMPVSAPKCEYKATTDFPNEIVEVRKTNTIAVKLPTDELLCNKTYMSYKSITSKSSLQYKYIHSDAIILDDRGFLMSSDGEGYYGVALGSYFGEIGSRYIFTLQRPDGSTHELKVVKVEAKSDKHTCEHNYKAGSNDVIEFVIDTKTAYMQQNIWGNGLIFQGNFNNCEDFNGNIVGIKEVINDEVLLV